jgi:thiol-disulfide isomerase/thioredoxin
MNDAGVLIAVLAAVALFSAWWKRRDGQVRRVADRFTAQELASLGVPAGSAALLEFTAPHCAPCRATKQVLDDVARLWPEVAVVAVDVGDALAVSKAHHVMRAPTTFVLGADGAVRGRIGGVPDPGELASLLEPGDDRRPPRGRRVSADVHVEAASSRSPLARRPGSRRSRVA